MTTYTRQPIVAVLGHIDHGKTTLLDQIRGSSVAAREAGAITQHIGATEVSIKVINEICSSILGKTRFKIPGLLFIDTPGHQAFVSLRKRGGALADLAVLVVDINEGFKPQTIESLNILKQYKTPFLVAANKIDLIPHWKSLKGAFSRRLSQQDELASQTFNDRFYELVGGLYKRKFQANLYDAIKDFRKNLAVVPVSAKTGEGIPELLMVLSGLAQKYLEKQLRTPMTAPARGSILEVKEEKGWGTTMDIIIHHGKIKDMDTIVVGTKKDPIVTSIRALLRPKPMLKGEKSVFVKVQEVSAAAGVKICAPNTGEALPGSSLEVVENNLEEVINRIKNESRIDIRLEDEGIIIKTDTLGSLEALAYQLQDKKTPFRVAEVGNVSHKDVVNASTNTDPLHRVIIGFNVNVLPDAKEEIRDYKVELILGSVIYTLLERHDDWVKKKKEEIEALKKEALIYPAVIRFLENCAFRLSKPAIIGVRVLSGSIKTDERLMRDDGTVVGKIKSIQSEKKSLQKAIQGAEVAIAITKAVVGRNIKEEDILFVDIPEGDAKKLSQMELTYDEREALDKILEIKRKENRFWGI
ncbi:MAG TPA: translation initiation factor IF-2 [Thermoplasmata archaeon]|nr:translation initiation factor IF-2 [Thermoplasmata archaeon]